MGVVEFFGRDEHGVEFSQERKHRDDYQPEVRNGIERVAMHRQVDQTGGL